MNLNSKQRSLLKKLFKTLDEINEETGNDEHFNQLVSNLYTFDFANNDANKILAMIVTLLK